MIRTARYIEMNPVRGGLAAKAADWPRSSARAHLEGVKDLLLAGASWPPEDLRGEWSQILSEPDDQEILLAIRKHTHTGHPLGSDSFIATLEKIVGRLLRALPRGRPRRREKQRENSVCPRLQWRKTR